MDASVVAYKKLLDAEFDYKWDAKYKKKKRKHEQATLLDTDNKKQGRLI